MTRNTYAVRLPDGTYLGRMSLSAPLGPVPPPFRYTYDDRTAAEIAASFAGVTDYAIVEEISDPFPASFDARGWADEPVS